MQKPTIIAGAMALTVGLSASQATAQAPRASNEQPTIWTADQGSWAPLPDIFPAGGLMKVIAGDPANGPATLRNTRGL